MMADNICLLGEIRSIATKVSNVPFLALPMHHTCAQSDPVSRVNWNCFGASMTKDPTTLC